MTTELLEVLQRFLSLVLIQFKCIFRVEMIGLAKQKFFLNNSILIFKWVSNARSLLERSSNFY